MDNTKKSEKADINKDLKKMLIWAIVISVAFVVGIPILILGAVNSIWALLAFGIACVVIGFYGAPIIWVQYGSNRTLKRVVDAVMEEHITTNAEIAQQLQIRERDAKAFITKAINKKYITGYIYNGVELIPNEKEEKKKKIVVQNKCKNCGAPLKLDEKGNYHCPYCNSIFEKE